MDERDRFLEAAQEIRRVLGLAHGIAKGFGRDTATEHVLIALAREKESVAASVLIKLGIKADTLSNTIFSLSGQGDVPWFQVKDLTPSVRRIAVFAVNEMLRLDHDEINTGHLLLGVVHEIAREGEGVAITTLAKLGVSIEQVHAQTLQVLDEHYVPPALPPEAATLVAEGEHILTCTWCNARSPHYFRYCFNCGRFLVRRVGKSQLDTGL